jgi:hypothetical protein
MGPDQFANHVRDIIRAVEINLVGRLSHLMMVTVVPRGEVQHWNAGIIESSVVASPLDRLRDFDAPQTGIPRGVLLRASRIVERSPSRVYV